MALAAVKKPKIIEFGDFQTPLPLATEVARLVLKKFPNVVTVIEPTCGVGNFLKASIAVNQNLKLAIGWEINPEYIQQAKNSLSEQNTKAHINIKVENRDLFSIDWKHIEEEDGVKQPLLFIGNPPWVTNAQLGKLESKNLPKKSNFQGYSGFEAITGKSNFDISEWMLIKIAEHISRKKAAMAFIVKTSVARKIFAYIYKNRLLICNQSICHIDAKKYFNVSVDACIFYAEGCLSAVNEPICPIYDDFNNTIPVKTMGFTNGKLFSDIIAYMELRSIDKKSEFSWRSGIKHDCSQIMEFNKKGENLINGLKKKVIISMDYLYPMYKSSHIAKPNLPEPSKYMLVTEKDWGRN